MHKLRLDIDALAVESFGTGGLAPWRVAGTVKAHQEAGGAAERAAEAAAEAAEDDAPEETNISGCGTCGGDNCG